MLQHYSLTNFNKMMFWMFVLTIKMAFQTTTTIFVNGDVVLSERILQMTLDSAAILSNNEAITTNTTTATDTTNDITNFSNHHQALVTRKDGFCYGIFRGRSDNYNTPLLSNAELSKVCFDTNVTVTATTRTKRKRGAIDDDNEEKPQCCLVRQEFQDDFDSLASSYDFETELCNCAQGCVDCVVLAGHGQGGALASAAAIRLSDLNPYVITFGEPPSMSNCSVITSERWYRYVNAIESDVSGISYDPAPFAQEEGTSDNVVFGHLIVLGPDAATEGLAYMGLNSTTQLSPTAPTAHSMTNYYDKIQSLMHVYGGDDDEEFPVGVQGFGPLSFCTQNEECETNLCQQEANNPICVGVPCQENDNCTSNHFCSSSESGGGGVCLPKLGSCMNCQEDSDCFSGKCYMNHCTSTSVKVVHATSYIYESNSKKRYVDNECTCFHNEDCVSGRCESISLTQRICLATASLGSKCNEHSDCRSGNCNWRYRCGPAIITTKDNRMRHDDTTQRVGITFLTIVFVGCLAIGYYRVQQYKKRQGYTRIVTYNNTTNNNTNGSNTTDRHTSTGRNTSMDKIKSRMHEGDHLPEVE